MRIDDEDLVPENLDSVENLVRFITAKSPLSCLTASRRSYLRQLQVGSVLIRYLDARTFHAAWAATGSGVNPLPGSN